MTPAGDPRPIVFHLITRLELGGAQETTLATVRLLDRRTFEPVLGYGPGGLLDVEAAALAGVRLLPCRHLVREVRPARDLLALLALRRAVARLVREGRPVIVHTHSSKAGILGRWAARLAGAGAVVHTVHGFGITPSQPALLRMVFTALERVTGRVTDLLIFVSEANRREASLLGIRARGRAVLVRSALPVDDFFPDRAAGLAWRRREGIPDDAPLIGQVACLKPQKDPLAFVSLAAAIARRRPEARFLVAGDGALRPEVEAAAAAAGLAGRLTLLGWRRDVPDLLRALDCLVLTSRWEGLPKSLVEGILSGVPVVANAVDGVAEVVSRWGGGFVVPARDLDAMTERVLGILDGTAPVIPADRAALAAEFDERAMVRRHEELYRGLAATSR